MAKASVLLVGATGETGKHILEALTEDKSFDLTCFIRTSSESSSGSTRIRGRGIKTVTGNLDDSIESLVSLLQNIDIVICCLSPPAIRSQIALIDAAVQAGVKRFVPCNWGTPAARGILSLRDTKEAVHDHIFRHHLGFTIIDVGFWYQASIPKVPSGRFDSAIFMPNNDVVNGGETPNMLIDARDVGKITVELIKRKDTLNKRIIAYGELISQNEIHQMIEAETGERLVLTHTNESDARSRLQVVKEQYDADPGEGRNRFLLAAAQYAITKYVRADNTPENAEYLGYIDARNLLPHFKYMTFAEFLDDLMAGSVSRPYEGVVI